MFGKRIIVSLALAYDLFKVMVQLLYGAWRISSLKKPIVSIFGATHMPEMDYYFQQAHQLAERLVNNNISVLTGGGPGIMQGASCGAFRNKSTVAKSIGIGVKGLQEKRNSCVQEYFELNHFFARKWLLTNYSSAFVVFPGGFGTLDELAGALTLMQTGKIPRVPLILIGKEYWHDFLTWIQQEAITHGTLIPKDKTLIMVTDDLDEAFCLIEKNVYRSKRRIIIMKISLIKEIVVLLWLSIKNGAQLIYGVYRIWKLRHPVISIFGGKWVKADSPYAHKAFELARKCAENNIAVLTGGGPGAMEAAQCGATVGDKHTIQQSLGIAVSGVDEEFTTYCHGPFIRVTHLYVRKWLLIRYSFAYIIFPGGIGTVDELFELFNEVKLKKHEGLIIVIGKDFWKSLLAWMTEAMGTGEIRAGFQSVFVVTDDIEHALSLILREAKKQELSTQ